MNNIDRLNEAERLLKELSCPEPIMTALWLWRMTVKADMVKYKNWEAWSKGQLIEGETEPAGSEKLLLPGVKRDSRPS